MKKKTGEFEIMEFQGKKFSGLALNSYEGEEQLEEFLMIFRKTYVQEFDKNIDEIRFINNLNKVSNKSIYTMQVHNSDKTINNFLYEQDTLITPTVENVISYNTNAQAIYQEEGTYGIEGVSDLNHIAYTVDMVRDSVRFGEDQLPTIAYKAAYIWFKIAKFQAFKNGNKRTAMVSALVFLHSNSYNFQFKNGIKDELINMSQRIAQFKETDKEALDLIHEYLLDNVVLNLNNREWKFLEKLSD
ncbi:type II toxin-antitoxin system death-on-curing family toxin [Companilactobacillus jidongensis]|uniref:type II toxin-antitoxin system death-on-curing family toxin n=1 Tax=Companilactobacillus jidongensis TaxID=2486006 RepID=UPI0013DDEFA2|nr:type II toxin-antitoxin system death-on-curing family toxin [Companilactobacillus jidongensis]